VKLLRAFLAFVALWLATLPAQAASNWYVSSVAYAAVAQWAANHAYSVGSYVRQLATPTVGNERVFKATSISGTGTSAGSEPAWNLGNGATTTDNAGANQIVWTEVTGKESEQATNAWAAPAAGVSAFPSGKIGTGSGDQIFVDSNHAESRAAAVSFGCSICYFFVVNRTTAAIPPTSADLTTGASVTTTTTNAISIASGLSNSVYIRGIAFHSGSGANSTQLNVASGLGAWLFCELCTLDIPATGNGAVVSIGQTNTGTTNRVWLKDSTLSTGMAANGAFSLANGARVEMWNSSAYGGGSNFTANSALTAFNGGSGGLFIGHGLDLSGLTGLSTGLFVTNPTNSFFQFYDCKLPSGVTISSASQLSFASTIALDNCDDGTNSRNYRLFRLNGGGTLQQNSQVVRTGGATDGVTPISWQSATGSVSVNPGYTWNSPQLASWNSATGSPITYTIYLAANSASALTNAQLWMEIEALTSSASPMGTVTSSQVADFLPTTTASNLSTDTSCWDSKAPARQNSHSYAVGDAISLASNTCRVFVATAAGTSSGSEPGGYASAVDGGAVTDGGATFRALIREKMTVSVTPQQAGYVLGTIRAAATSLKFYIDPKIN